MAFLMGILTVLEIILWLALLACGAASMAGLLTDSLLQKYEWQLGFFSHFHFQYFLLQMVFGAAMVLLLLCKKQLKSQRAWVLVLPLILILWEAVHVVPFYLPHSNPPASDILARVKILHVNVWGRNRNVQAVAQLIQTNQPDIVSVQEYNIWWQKALPASGALKDYPYHVIAMDDGLYSKIPLLNVRVDYLPETGKKDSTILTDITLAKTPVTLLIAHPPTVVRQELFDRLKRHFARWETLKSTFNPAWIVLGDLNVTPWSPQFVHFTQATGLRDSEYGFGLQRSYPVFQQLKAVPIDHCLISPHFVTLDRRLGPLVGSDHFPLIVELALIAPGSSWNGID